MLHGKQLYKFLVDESENDLPMGKNNPTFLTGVSQLGKSLHLKWQMFRKLFQVFGASTNLGVQNKKTTGFVGMLLGLKSTHGLKRLLELL